MSNTANLGLPLIQPSQAQKHVTVNEALARLDGLAQMALQSVTTATPPIGATDGEAYGVPSSASGDWLGQDGQVAIYSNSGWIFLTPRSGWRAHVIDAAAGAIYDGTAWQLQAVAVSAGGASSVVEVLEFDHSITAGSTNATSVEIPSHSIVMGVTARIRTALGGTVGSWRLGVASSDNRYGSGLGTELGSYVKGLTGQPQTYYADTPLLLTAESGSFTDGEIRFALHLFRITLPRA